MKWILTIILIGTSCCFCQSISVDFNSPENIRKFADHLFCEKDYLRANFEYERLLGNDADDSLLFKIGLGYSFIRDYQNGNNNFSRVTSSSIWYDDAKLQQLKLYFLLGDYKRAASIYEEEFEIKENKYAIEGNKLNNFIYFFDDDTLPLKAEIIFPFNEDEKKVVSSFYDWKTDPPYKSSFTAGILSAVIPGAGKMYLGEWGDGITAFLVTGLFAFLAYDNFEADHDTRAWIFTGLGAFFYAGNIYGSVTAAQIFNARIEFEFKQSLNVYLSNKNYFTPEYEFCK